MELTLKGTLPLFPPEKVRHAEFFAPLLRCLKEANLLASRRIEVVVWTGNFGLNAVDTKALRDRKRGGGQVANKKKARTQRERARVMSTTDDLCVGLADVLSVGLKACAFGRSFLEGKHFDMFVVMLGGKGVLLILRLGFRCIGCGCASLIF